MLYLNGSVGLAHTEDGTLYVANFTDRTIYRVTSTDLEYVATVPGPSNGVLGFISGAGGTLYGTSWNSHAIYAIEPAYMDSVRLVAGGNGQGNTDGEVSTAKFNQPNGILAVAGGDTIYVSDFGSKNIRMITGVSTGIAEQPHREGIHIWPNPVTEFAGLDLEIRCPLAVCAWSPTLKVAWCSARPSHTWHRHSHCRSTPLLQVFTRSRSYSKGGRPVRGS